MLLRNEVKNASDVELLTAILGNKVAAEALLRKAGGSLFALLHGLPNHNGDLFCAEGSEHPAHDCPTHVRHVA